LVNELNDGVSLEDIWLEITDALTEYNKQNLRWRVCFHTAPSTSRTLCRPHRANSHACPIRSLAMPLSSAATSFSV